LNLIDVLGFWNDWTKFKYLMKSLGDGYLDVER
jgi:hypothetical protein